MSTLNVILFIFFGGGLGSVSRFGLGKLSLHFYDGKFPLGTLITNTLACLIVGLTLYFFKDKLTANDALKCFLIIGFCGGFSTFSAFGLETVKLIQDGLIAIAFANVVISLLLGFGIMYLLVK